jgi:hypothetical protein
VTDWAGATHQFGGLGRFVRAVVRALALLSLTAAAGVGALALVLARDGYDTAEVFLTLLLLAAPAIVLFFVVGVRELLQLPERLRRMPQRGAEMSELTRIAREARTASWRRAPLLLWRLRGLVSSTRDLVGFALPLRVFTPPFLALTLGALLVSTILVGVGLIALLVLAVS